MSKDDRHLWKIKKMLKEGKRDAAYKYLDDNFDETVAEFDEYMTRLKKFVQSLKEFGIKLPTGNDNITGKE